MKLNTITILILFSSLFSQAIYTGESSFHWDTGWFGSEGDFNAELSFDGFLNGEYSGSMGVSWADSVGSTHLFIPSIEPADTSGSLYNMFIMYMKDADGILNPQTWDVAVTDAIDFQNLDALMMYREDVDSVLIAQLMDPFINGEVDFSDFEGSLAPLILDLAVDSYLPISGEITLTETNGNGFMGLFNGSFVQASSISFMTISDGEFSHTIPGSELLPGVPENLLVELNNEVIHLSWTANDDWSTSSYNIYHSHIPNDEFVVIGNTADSEFTVSSPFNGNNYFYVTAANFISIESNPSNTAFIFVELDEFEMGDVNMDDAINVLDIVLVVNFILEDEQPTADQLELADMNMDGIINVLDIVQIINIILER